MLDVRTRRVDAVQVGRLYSLACLASTTVYVCVPVCVSVRVRVSARVCVCVRRCEHALPQSVSAYASVPVRVRAMIRAVWLP